jgi:glycosyltransferase involved in cell wall biosynthesis
MRVLHVITALGVGGAERMLLKLLGARALADVEQQVVAMLPWGSLAGPMRATGTPVRQLNFLGPAPLVAGAWHLTHLARQVRPQIIQGWMYHGNLGASLARAAVGEGAALVWGIRQSLTSLQGENLLARVAIRINRALSAQPDRLLFNSRRSIEQHDRLGFDTRRSQYLPNGFDTQVFAPDVAARVATRAAWGAGEHETVFGLLARYHPAKDHATFLVAARRVADSHPLTRFVMAGTGVDAQNAELAIAVAAAGLQGRVHLLGERSDVPAVMAGLDVAVSCSSRIEGFSNSIGEAMACGLPCVATDVGEASSLLEGLSSVVPPQHPQALAAAMNEMVDLGPEGRALLGERSRERIESAYALEVVAAQYRDLYCDLADRRRRPR